MTEPFRPLDDLPKTQRSRDEGEPPDAEPRFGPVLIDWCHAQALKRDEEWEATHPDPNRFHFSDAGACSRAVAYAALGVPVSNPADAQGHYIMWLGTVIHDALQAALVEKYGEHAKIEVQIKDDGMGGRIDAVIELESGNTKPYIISIEIKSAGGFGFKLASARFQGPPEGPKYGHKLQAFLGARGRDADECVIVYLTRDPNNTVPDDADPMLRVLAEWTYTREQYEPLADAEIKRITRIHQMVDEGTLPARKIPDPEFMRKAPERGEVVITNPAKREWAAFDEHQQLVDAGTFWACGYCRYQDTCAKTGAHREPVDVLVKLGVLDKGADDDERDSRGQ